MKENMEDECKEKTSLKEKEDDILMKPFTLGWSREVVRRVITKNGTPTCDVYYFTPNGKKIRSMIEIKGNLTDGLSPECFSYKRELLGFGSMYERVRDARNRKKEESQKSMKKEKGTLRTLKKREKSETFDRENDLKGKENKKKKTSTEKDSVKLENEIKEDKVDIKNENDDKFKKEAISIKLRRTRPVKKSEEEVTSYRNKKKTKTKPEKYPKEKLKVNSQTVRKKKEVLKKIRRGKQAKQAKVLPSKKILRKVRGKGSSKQTVSKPKSVKETGLKNKRGKKKILKNTKKSLKNQSSKSEVAKDETSNCEVDKKSVASDLKSIVKKNIGKYREMREKQKLGVIKSQSQKRKIVIENLSWPRSAPISKNKPFYLKPLEKGWRRELVYRIKSARMGNQADVYYFHPNGKKLRSTREIAQNLTHGLSIEWFTFRKEPLGCGEPSEIVRNARSNHKNFSTD